MRAVPKKIHSFRTMPEWGSHCWKLSEEPELYNIEFAKVRNIVFSEELKEAAEMEKTLHDTTGEPTDFFKGVFEDTGMNYDEQE